MYDIAWVSEADLDGITTLLQNNAPSRGGALTGEFPRDKVVLMTQGDARVIVAHREGNVVGVLFSSSKRNVSAPSVRAMLDAWPGSDDAYIYGPACIADTERGQGLLAKLYTVLRDYYPNREAVLFIRADNVASIRAHERLGMHEVSRFLFEGFCYLIFSDRAV
ncbi:N-acetyltransferase [Dyella monticola]|uniref:N-acetyltransferase n=1 Tax=Dyella monticola TaxID=1927958 RepID=A0A370X3S2_9GAMM|nr:GNAT family N-acetyltransferase [Dyella monticola]RDS82930.1 N-acetyltransferase [Dyella monticola]